MNQLKTIFNDLMDLAWPNLCLLCEKPLIQGEKHLCMNCLYEIPKTNFNSFQTNLAAERFFGKIPFEKATAGFLYKKESKMQEILELLKYKGEKELGDTLAGFIAANLLSDGFFEDIDLLVPVPLHKKKAKKRGYNQSEWITRGLSRITGIPSDSTNLCRTKKNTTQTTKSIWERWENTQNLFTLKDPNAFADKHILLVDDVLTSGSTLTACGDVLLNASGVRISFFALALA